MSTAMVVDGQNLLMRAIFAAKNSQMSSGGVATGPLVIFINSLAKHVQEEQPGRLIVVWDGGTSAQRVHRLPSYKAHRKPVPEDEKEFRDSASGLTRRFLALANVQQIQATGIEADDLIAWAWNTVQPEHAERLVVLSSDKDFLQLVGLNPHDVPTELIRLSSAGTPTDRWTQSRIMEELGYHPAYWPLVTALTGDSSDGVPGLPGVGPKRALKLLEAAGWDWTTLLEGLDQDAVRIAQACRDVVDLRVLPGRLEVPLWRPTHPGSMLWEPMIDFLNAYELASVKDRLRTNALWSVRDLITVTDGDNGRNDRP